MTAAGLRFDGDKVVAFVYYEAPISLSIST